MPFKIYPASINLSQLNGKTGFTITSNLAFSQSGKSVNSAGNVNGDAFDDFTILDNLTNCYVVFGHAKPWAPDFNLANLNGQNGFKFANKIISCKSAGDANGDEIGDLVVSAVLDGQEPKTFLVFGTKQPWPAIFDLATLDGSNGVRFDDYAGTEVGAVSNSIGDITGDGLSETLIGGKTYARSFVAFGKKNWNATFDLGTLDGSTGFTLDLTKVFCVTAVNDLNGDRRNDFALGCDPLNSRNYVLFGRSNWPAFVNSDFIDGKRGFGIVYSDSIENTIKCMTYGDLFGKQNTSLVLGAPLFSPQGQERAGSVFVLNEKNEWPAVFDLDSLDGQSGFRFDGENPEDQIGQSLAVVPNFNKDGHGALVIGAGQASTSKINTGKTIVAFGRANWPATFNLGLLLKQPNSGVIIEGENEEDQAGTSVSDIGDIDGDGNRKIIIGAPQASTSEQPESGKSYVISSNQFFELTTHLNLENGGDLLLQPGNLRAAFNLAPEDEGLITFSMNDVTHGNFSSVDKADVPRNRFLQSSVQKEQVKFAYDHSGVAPNFNVSLEYGGLTTVPQSRNMSLSTVLPSNDNAGQKLLISGLVLGSIGFLLCVFKGFNAWRNSRNLEFLTKHTSDRESKADTKLLNYNHETMQPLVQKVFTSLKTTYFLGFRSEKDTQSYIAAIQNVLSHLVDHGVNLNLNEMEQSQKDNLVQIIVQQIRAKFTSNRNSCFRFFKPEATPQQLEDNAEAIAEAIRNNLTRSQPQFSSHLSL